MLFQILPKGKLNGGSEVMYILCYIENNLQVLMDDIAHTSTNACVCVCVRESCEHTCAPNIVQVRGIMES
jgi:hypothetical protein